MNKSFDSKLTLIELGYLYLQKKSRTTHKPYTIADLLEVCERILRWNEQKNRFQKNTKINFEAISPMRYNKSMKGKTK